MQSLKQGESIMEVSRKYGISRNTIKKNRNSLSLYGSQRPSLDIGTRYNWLNTKKEFSLKVLANKHMTKQLLWEQYKEEDGVNAYSNAQFGHYLHVEKFCTFVFTLFVLLSIRTAFGSSTKKVYLTKDNTPSRLTSVAHLGGLLFYKPLASYHHQN
jgi:transposase